MCLHFAVSETFSEARMAELEQIAKHEDDLVMHMNDVVGMESSLDTCKGIPVSIHPPRLTACLAAHDSCVPSAGSNDSQSMASL